MSWALLGELPTAVALVGGALCLAGVAVSRRRPRAGAARAGRARPRLTPRADLVGSSGEPRVEERNRRMLRARDAMDRVYASRSTSPPSPGSRTCRPTTSSAPSGPPSARRRTATCSAGASNARCTCCGRPGAVSPTSAWTSGSPASARSAGRSPRCRRVAVGYRLRGPAPTCRVLRDALAPTRRFRRSTPHDRLTTVGAHVLADQHHVHVRPRPGPGARVLRRQARPRGRRRPGPRLHALAHHPRAGGPVAADPAGAVPGRRRWTRRRPRRPASWSPRAPRRARSSSRRTTCTPSGRRSRTAASS